MGGRAVWMRVKGVVLRQSMAVAAVYGGARWEITEEEKGVVCKKGDERSRQNDIYIYVRAVRALIARLRTRLGGKSQ